MKAGLEIHQQLDCGKLFCTCDSLDIGNNSVFVRKLHATSSEMGTIDVAAKAEGVREFTYFNKSCNCLVYTDEETKNISKLLNYYSLTYGQKKEMI